jgi:transcriptional regulator with XRE-family HTH domain
LRRLRQERGLTLEVLAFTAGLSTGAVTRIELGSASPSWVTVRRLARALGVSMSQLITEVERAE